MAMISHHTVSSLQRYCPMLPHIYWELFVSRYVGTPEMDDAFLSSAIKSNRLSMPCVFIYWYFQAPGEYTAASLTRTRHHRASLLSFFFSAWRSQRWYCIQIALLLAVFWEVNVRYTPNAKAAWNNDGVWRQREPSECASCSHSNRVWEVQNKIYLCVHSWLFTKHFASQHMLSTMLMCKLRCDDKQCKTFVEAQMPRNLFCSVKQKYVVKAQHTIFQ